ncbi:MAG: MBL fold metallo-hydrolase [Pyrinomonadaceae bacterium]
MKKRIFLTLIVLFILVSGFLAWTFTAAKIEFTPLAADVELPVALPPAGMTISALPTGAMKSKAMFAYRGGGFNDERQFVMTAFLVRHPKGDLLFDTGFGSTVDEQIKTEPWLLRQMTTYTVARPVSEQLSVYGYPIEKLAGVVLTHAHWDHVSGLDSLPRVPVWVSAAERSFISSRSSKTALINSFYNVNYKEYAFNDGAYLGFPNSFDVWGDGSVVLVPAPGHTPGSIIAFISLPSGMRFALLGDLVWQMEGIEIPAERPWLSRRLVAENDAEVRENIARIAAIHKRFPDIHMIPAHDARASKDIPVLPGTAR